MATKAWTYSTKEPVKRAVFDGMKSNNDNLFDEVVVGFTESSVVSRNNQMGNNERGLLDAQCKRKRPKKRKPKSCSTVSLTNEDQEEESSFMLFKYETLEHKKRKLKQKKNVQRKMKCIENKSLKKRTRERAEQPSEQLSSDTAENDLCLMVEGDEKYTYAETTQLHYAPESIMSRFVADVNKMFKKKLKKKTVSDRKNFVDLSMEAPRQEVQDRFHISLSGLDRSPELELKESFQESPVKPLDDDAHKNLNISVCQPSLLQNSLADDKEAGSSDFVIISSIYGSPPLTKNRSGSKCNNKTLTEECSFKPRQERASLSKPSHISLGGECHRGRERSLKDTASYETLVDTEGNSCAKSTATYKLSKNDTKCESFQNTTSKESSKGTVTDEKMMKVKTSEGNKYSVCGEHDKYSECTKRKKSFSDVSRSQVFKSEASTKGVLVSEQTSTQSTATDHSSSYITCTTSDGHSQDDMSRGVASGSLPTSTDYTYSFVSTYSDGTSTGGAMSNKGTLDSPHVNMKKFYQLNSTCYRSKENIGDVQFPPSISPILNARVERTPQCLTQHAMRPIKPKPKTEKRDRSQANRKCSTMLFGSDVEDVNFPSSPGLTTVISGYASTGVNDNKDPPPIEIVSKSLPMKQKAASMRENPETPNKTLFSKVGSTTLAKSSGDMSQDRRVTLGAIDLNNAPTIGDRGVGIPKLKSQNMNLTVKKGVQCSRLPSESNPMDRKGKAKQLLQRKCSSPIDKLVTGVAVDVCVKNLKDRQFQEACLSPVSEKTTSKGECEIGPDIVLEQNEKNPVVMKSSTPVSMGKPLTVSLGLSPIHLQGAESEEELCIIPSLEVNSDEIIVPSFLSVSELMDKDRVPPEQGSEHLPANLMEKTTRQIPENFHDSTSNLPKQLCVTVDQSHRMEVDACNISGPDGVGVGSHIAQVVSESHIAQVVSEKANQSQPDREINLGPGSHGSQLENQTKSSDNTVSEYGGEIESTKTTQKLTKQCRELAKSTIVCMINRFIHKLRKRDGLECT